MRDSDCTKGLQAKVVVPIEDDKITLILNDEVLDTILQEDVIKMEDQILFGKLLSLENIAITYNTLNSRVSKVLKQ